MKYIVAIDESNVRDMQIYYREEEDEQQGSDYDVDDLDDENWHDWSGDVLVGVFEADNEEAACLLAAELICIPSSALTARSID